MACLEMNGCRVDNMRNWTIIIIISLSLLSCSKNNVKKTEQPDLFAASHVIVNPDKVSAPVKKDDPNIESLLLNKTVEQDTGITLVEKESSRPAEDVESDPEYTVQVKKKRSVRIEEESDRKYVVLNFDKADLATVLASFGELLNINYVTHPDLTGMITIQSYRRFAKKDLFHVFLTILEVHGLTAVKSGAIYKIVPLDYARSQPLEIDSGRKVKYQIDSGYVTQIIPLEYIKADNILKVMKNLMPPGSDIVVFEPSNMLIATALPSALIKIMKIVEAVDIPLAEHETVKTFVYYIEHGDANRLSVILNDLYKSADDSAKTGQPPRETASPKSAKRGKGIADKQYTANVVAETSGELKGRISIMPYEAINALIIKASPKDYMTILDTLKKLDIPPKQVLIEVMIAEVSLTDNTQYGIEWLLTVADDKDTLLTGVTSELQPGTVSANINPVTGEVVNIVTAPSLGSPFAAIIRPDKYGAILHAFASLGQLNVLSSPQILAMDNHEAKIEIGDDIPVTSGFQQQALSTSGDGTIAVVPSAKIEYRTTGVILSVTPRISEKNMVKLDITQEISNRGADVSLAGITAPSFTKKKAQTMGIVRSGHSLIIGGMIQERINNTTEGVPILSRIPILGYLFKTTREEVTKTESMLIVTPYVVSSSEEADAVVKKFQNRIKVIRDDAAFYRYFPVEKEEENVLDLKQSPD